MTGWTECKFCMFGKAESLQIQNKKGRDRKF